MTKNSMRICYESFLKKAPAENKDRIFPDSHWALLMTFQHFIDQTYYDRNRYNERLRRLEAEVLPKPIAPTDISCPPPPH